jgi:DNA-binding CsgD family transcriptional regulator
MSIYETKRNNRIVELFTKGLTIKEIAELYKLSSERVGQIIRNAENKQDTIDKSE